MQIWQAYVSTSFSHMGAKTDNCLVHMIQSKRRLVYLVEVYIRADNVVYLAV